MIEVTMPNGQVVDIEDPTFDPAKLDPTQFDPSSEDPVGIVAPYLDRAPKWVVIGGLGDVMEARQCRDRWSDVKILGVDPDPRAIQWQERNGWPSGCGLLPLALSDSVGTAPIRMDSVCCPSMHPRNVARGPVQQVRLVKTTTLDVLDRTYGPFDDCVLWLDLEGWDYTALKGATDLLASGRVMAVNVEVRYDDPPTNAAMRELLVKAGYNLVLAWFRQWWGHNEVWNRL